MEHAERVRRDQIDRMVFPPKVMAQGEIDRLSSMSLAEMVEHNRLAIREIRRQQRAFDRGE